MFCRKCKRLIDDEYNFCPTCGRAVDKKAGSGTGKRKHGEGSVYKMGGNRKRPWAVAVSDANGQHFIGSASSRPEALAMLEAYKASDRPINWNMTVESVFLAWNKSHFQRLTASGISGYNDAWRRFGVYRDLKMRELKTAHIQSVIDSAILESGAPLSKSGKEKIKQLASQLCQWAMQQDIISKNYAEFVRISAPPSKEKQIFTYDEILAFKQCKESYDAQIVLVLIYSGMRINELFSMKLADVHLPQYMIGGEKTKAGIQRTIPIHPEILPIIEAWIISATATQEYLVVNTAGGMVKDDNWRTRNYYPLLKKLGIRTLSPHSTRHTFATLMRKANVNEELIARIVGHSKFATTAGIYIHTDTDELFEAVKSI